MNDTSEYVSTREAQELIGVSRPTMARLLREGAFTRIERSPVDRRLKLLLREEVEHLARLTRPALPTSAPKNSAAA